MFWPSIWKGLLLQPLMTVHRHISSVFLLIGNTCNCKLYCFNFKGSAPLQITFYIHNNVCMYASVFVRVSVCGSLSVSLCTCVNVCVCYCVNVHECIIYFWIILPTFFLFSILCLSASDSIRLGWAFWTRPLWGLCARGCYFHCIWMSKLFRVAVWE